jgi:hypothetical protein
MGEVETFVMQLLSQLTLLFVFFLHTVSTEVGLMKLPPGRLRCLLALYGWQVPHEFLLWFFQYCQFVCMYDNYMPDNRLFIFQIWIYNIKLSVFIKIRSFRRTQHQCSTQVAIFLVNFFSVKFSKCTKNYDIINHNFVYDFKILNIIPLSFM